jgi:hypothetical protein
MDGMHDQPQGGARSEHGDCGEDQGNDKQICSRLHRGGLLTIDDIPKTLLSRDEAHFKTQRA